MTGLEDCLTLDGQNTPTHSLPMGGFTHTGVGNATARTNYAAAGQVVDGSLIWGGTSGGSANAQTIAITPTVTALVAGQSFRFIAGFTNTAAATLMVNATAATAFRKAALGGPAALAGGEVQIGNTYSVTFDGTYFILNALDTEGPSTWTPTDASGASLSLTVGNAVYYKVGKMVTILYDIAYPSTSNGSDAKIGGLPFTSYNSTGSDFNGAITSTLTDYVVINVNTNATTFQMWDNTTSIFRTNVSLSTKRIQGSLTYFTN